MYRLTDLLALCILLVPLLTSCHLDQHSLHLAEEEQDWQEQQEDDDDDDEEEVPRSETDRGVFQEGLSWGKTPKWARAYAIHYQQKVQAKKSPLWAQAYACSRADSKGEVEACAYANQAEQAPHEAFLYAAQEGHIGVMQTLLQRGIDPDSKNDKGKTALMWAAEHGYKAVVQLLIDNKAQIDLKDTYYGQPALIWAAEKGHTGIVKLLLENDANPNTQGEFAKETALTISASYGFLGVVKELLKWKADFTIQSNYGAPLHRASKNRHLEVVKELLEQGANPNIKDERGRTPLMDASNGLEAPEVIKELLKWKANPNIQCNYTMPPWRLLYSQKVELGGVVIHIDQGKTALMFAAQMKIKKQQKRS